MENSFNKTVAPENFTQAAELVKALWANLAFLVDLIPGQKTCMLRADEQSMQFARLIRDLATEHGDISPQAGDFEEFQKDVDMYDQLRLLKIKVDPLIEL